MIKIDGRIYYSNEEVLDMIKNAEDKVREEWFTLFEKTRNMMLPDEDFMFHGSKNTTVKFRNGNSITVRRMEGEEDSIEVALAFILAFQNYGKKTFRKLVKQFKEVQ